MGIFVGSMTPRAVRALSKSENGRVELGEILGLSSSDDDISLQEAIQLDCLYDCVLFSSGKGFPWHECSLLLELTKSLLNQCKGQPLVNAIQLYGQLCESCQAKIDENHLKQFTEYVFTSFMRHYNLYQAVLCLDREKLTIASELLVETVSDPPPFTDGKPVKTWEYEQKIEAIEQKGKEAVSSLEANHVAKKLEAQKNLEERIGSIETSDVHIEKEELSNLIASVAHEQVNSVMLSLTHNIDSSMSELATMLEKANVPRPADMGPPGKNRIKTANVKDKSGGSKEKSRLASSRTGGKK